MNWLKRVVWVVIGLVVVGAVAYAFRPQPISVELRQVTRGPLEVTIDEDGKTRIKEKYIVSTPVGGRLQRIDWREGDSVKCNQSVLASIHAANPGLLDARTLAQAKARVSAAKSRIERATARVEEIKIQLDRAEREFQRAQRLVQDDAISRSEFEDAQAAFRALNENYRSAKFDRDIAAYELELAEAALLHVRPEEDQEVSEYFPIHSPIDGVVLRVLQESSTVVTPGTPIMEVGDAVDLEIVVDVLTTDAVKIQPGTRVYLERWGGNRRLHGVVRLIEPSAFEKVSALGVEEQRVNVIVDFEEPPEVVERLRDGYRVEARMVIWEGKDVVRVPTSALFRDRNQWSVFVVRNHIAHKVPVELGHRNDRMAEVLSGLKEGESVVIHPGDNLLDGSRIRQLPGTAANP